MAPGEFNGPTARAELEKILVSAGFYRNERLSRFLRFVVERHLEGRNSELKESVIATEVFGRRADYDPKLDSIVRTEATRLRARLAEYYASEGRSDPVIIELPKGGYVPAITVAPPSAQPRKPGRPFARIRLAACLLLMLAAAGVLGTWLARQKEPVHIAVLPLENLGHDPANEYFADGLTAELIHNLSLIEGLEVRSQTSSFAFRRNGPDKPRSVRDVGKQLAADYLVEGSVLRAGQRLRIEAQVVRVRDDATVWSGKYDRELTDVFAIQEEISGGIVNSLRLKLGKGKRVYQTTAAAYDLYLQARASEKAIPPLLHSVNRAELFEQVISRDPSFAPAYAGLAAALAIRWSGLRPVPPDADWVKRMHAAAEKAIELDPLLSEAHRALGLVHTAEGHWELAEKSYRRALELDPSNPETRADFAVGFLLTAGRTAEAVQQARSAVSLDPHSDQARTVLTLTLLSAGRYGEAAEYAEKLSEGNTMKIQLVARARIAQGRLEEAIRLLEADKTPNKGFLGYAYARLGRRTEAEKVLVDNLLPNTHVLTYAGLGEKEKTRDALDRMAALSVWRVGQYLTYPELSLVLNSEEVKAVRRKFGLPE